MIRLLIVAIVSLFSLAANSATWVLSGGPGSELLGATGVVVGGNPYNVSFVDGSCNSLFAGCTSFAFTTAATAAAASTALMSQVFTGVYDADPSLTNGISDPTYGFVMTPYLSYGIPVYASFATNYYAEQYDTVTDFYLNSSLDTSGYANYVYAVWSPSAVPLPAAAWLFGSALLGLGVVKRKKA